MMNKIKTRITSNANIISLAAMLLVFAAVNPSFLNAYNVKNLFTSIAPLLIIACGATFVTLVGSLDLTMGAVCSCSNVIFVFLMPYLGAGSYVLAIGFGILAGFVLGVIHTKLKIPSFIASLGMMNVYNSMALLICPSPVSVTKEYKYIIGWGKATLGIFSMMTVLALCYMAVMFVVQKHTVVGKSMNMVGANERAARISAMKVDRTKIFAFTMCGMSSALAGIILAIKLQSSSATMGSTYTLLAVAAVLLGGTYMTGGKGSVLQSMIGAVMVMVIQNGMTIIGVDSFWSQIIFGGLILLAMALTTDRS